MHTINFVGEAYIMYNLIFFFFWLQKYCTVRSSRLQMFFKIGALKNFANFTGKHLCWNFLLICSCNFIKKRLQHRYLCEIFKKTVFYRTPPVAAFENIVKRNERKHNYNKVSYNYLGTPTQADHSSRG